MAITIIPGNWADYPDPASLVEAADMFDFEARINAALAQIITPGVLFSMPGVAQLGRSGNWPADSSRTFTKAILTCVGAPTDSPLTVEVYHNATVVTTLEIAAGSSTPDENTFTLNAVDGSLIWVNAASIGGTVPATGVVVAIL